MTTQEAFRRGVSDALRDRPRLFRNVAGMFLADCGDEWAADMSESWDQESRAAYDRGYDSV